MEDHNLLAVLPLESDSDSDSYRDTSTLPIAQSEGVVVDQDLFDSVCWKDRVRRLGERFSARSGGGQGEGSGSLWREPEISGPQVNQPRVVSEGQ